MSAFPAYLDSFQTIIVQFLIIVVGYIFALTNFFLYAEAVPFFRILRLVILPAIVFSELSICPLNWSSFVPLVHSALTQATIHVFSAIAAYFIPTADRFVQFLTFVYSYSHTCFVPYGYPVLRIVFGAEFLYIPVMMNVVQTLFVRPLHLWATFHIPPLAVTHDFAMDTDDTKYASAEGEVRGPETRTSGGEKPVPDIEAALDDGEADRPLDEVESESEDEEEQKPEGHNFRRNMIWAVAAPSNIAIIAGIVWNLIGVDWPLVLSTATGSFAKAYCACTMFCLGIAAHNHPFAIGQWEQIVPFLAVHHIANPLIAIAWAMALRLDTLTARACVLLSAMPVEWTGAWLVERCGSPRNAITATALWSHVIALPMFFCWLAVLGETGIFT
jgi:predicted permease